MTIGAQVFDGRVNVYRWDINTLTEVPWDGSLTAGSLTIGAVTLAGTTLESGRVPVALPSGGAGLTDTELRASAVPVSGAFYQATQPVSLASAPTTPVTGTFWQATQPISAASLPAHDVTNAGTFAVQVTSAPTTAVTGPLTDAQLRAVAVPVSGTFYQATQPVSLASAPTTPVTGTFWQATQPVSLATAPTTPVTGTFWQATQPVSAASLPLPSGAATNAAQGTAFGKTITYVPVAQGAAGTTQLAAASASNKHKILGCVLTMSAEGTLKFLDGTGDLTGAMDVAATGGFVLPAALIPYQVSATNSALSITTTTGAAKGVVMILTEP